MKVDVINNSNFDETVIDTLLSKDGVKNIYLDSHELNGTLYYSVSKDEDIIAVYDDYDEAKDLYHKQ